MTPETSLRDALMRLGASTAEAVAQVLEQLHPGAVTRGEVAVLADGAEPFAETEGLSVVVARSVDGEKELLGAIAFAGPAEIATAKAGGALVAAAAGAVGVVLGREVSFGEAMIGETAGLADAAPHAITTTFEIAGASCRLIQIVGDAVATALGNGNSSGPPDAVRRSDEDLRLELSEALTGIRMRVWAELGRTTLPLGYALGQPLGAVVELDRATEAPVDLYVNGLRFATGRLLVSDEGRWAFALDELTGAGPDLAGETDADEAIAGAAVADAAVADAAVADADADV
jgi:flagellar motor switch protein FliN/FliY